MRTLCIAVLCALPFIALADNDISQVNRSIRVEAAQSVGNVESVNGSIHVEDGATTRDISSVNGSIDIGNRATTGKVNTVNGGIHLDNASKIASIETVNGTVKVGAGTQVSGNVSAVNGQISLAKDASVQGSLENVNGRIELDAASVGKGIRTTNGDIDIGTGSRVQGGILVEKPHHIGWGKRRTPSVIIGPDAVVNGALRFERAVMLYVSDRATIGSISGATPIRFTGEQPSDADRSAAEKLEK
jgi:hypothetical protein